MATRKKTDRAAAEAWLSEPVTVRLFRDNGSYKEDKIVTVNGETVRIPRGEDVTIPRRFALVLAQGEAQDARTGALIERETARFAAESGALGLLPWRRFSRRSRASTPSARTRGTRQQSSCGSTSARA